MANKSDGDGKRPWHRLTDDEFAQRLVDQDLDVGWEDLHADLTAIGDEIERLIRMVGTLRQRISERFGL